MYTIKQYAVRVDRSVSSVRGWLRKGLLEKRHWGTTLIFNDDDIEMAEDIKKRMIEQKVKGMSWDKK